MTPAQEKELKVLGLIDQLAFELKDDARLADVIADRLEVSTNGRVLRDVLVRRRAEQSYYKQAYAEALKPYLDNIEEQNPILFSKASFPNTAIRTIYLRVYQAWLWLMDHHADRDKYRALRTRFEIVQSKYDVRIRRKNVVNVQLPGAVRDEKYDDLLPLQNRITEFLTKPMTQEMELFEQNNLSLSEADQEVISDSLAGLEGVTAKVERNLVKILRKKI